MPVGSSAAPLSNAMICDFVLTFKKGGGDISEECRERMCRKALKD